MASAWLGVAVYLLPLAAIWAAYEWRRQRRHRRSRDVLAESRSAGLTEPPSLHPRIDLSKCLGCGACVPACPEEEVIGLIDGKAWLTNPTSCIGHGACRTACPFDAIALVLGTETRGVEIPRLGPDFQTNVPGIFVAGELGGMGLIRNAIEQGRQAVEEIRKLPRSRHEEKLDLVIVGAGPAGFAASLAARQHGLRSVTLEQESLGGAVAHYPRGKIVMTAPAELPGVGRMHFRETTKEDLLGFFRDVERKAGLAIRCDERVESIERSEHGLLRVRTPKGSYTARAVLLAIGRRGTPRKLGVPGEELPKVVYSLIDPEQYRGQRVVVVGGGDSALEAAASIAEEPGSSVLLSYRRAAFQRAKPKNRARIERAVASGRIELRLASELAKITRTRVRISTGRSSDDVENDAVIVCTGGVLPTGFLRATGIEMETKRGTPLH